MKLMWYSLNKLLIFIFLISFGSGCAISSRDLETPKDGIKVEPGNIYLSSGVKKYPGAETEILMILQNLIDMTLAKNYSKLPEMISPTRGLYPDLKGLWTYEQVKEELKKPDSYFEIYFFDHDKLKKEKGTDSVHTVREILILSEGLKAELYFESKDSCEIKLKFRSNQTKEFDLNNAYFIREKGNWFVYRLF